jgi:flavin reductase (DIM6/NTAB) family NADH-FMN oxidoreductase RutF/DNA-binding GntR family transcriptional regulator
VSAEDFRGVISRLASGVTVITTRIGDAQYGMTASSVTSLSLDPPMMLICINRAVPTSSAISEAGVFGVNILGGDQGHLAAQFAAPNDDKFRDVDVCAGVTGVPLLGDALASIECEVSEAVSGGTHTVFLGRVVRATARDGEPLTYWRGSFGRFQFARDDAVYHQARALVLERRFGAAGVVDLSSLSDELQAERSSVFYALTRLVGDGLLRRDTDRGYVVVPFDASSSDEAFDARCVMELGVVHVVTGHVGADDLAELRRRFEAMAAMLQGDRFVDFDRYLDANNAFHEAVVGLARNPSLTAAFQHLSLIAVMARSFGASPHTSQVYVDVQGQLLEALERSDVTAARAAVVAYTRIAKQRARDLLEEAGGRL